MPKRTTPADATPLRVVIVTMDSHLSGAAARARNLLRRDFLGLELSVHAADEWGTDDAALARCHADIAQGDIVIATMLFLDDHVRAVMPALVARRDDCDAMVCCMSAAEIVKLTRVGKFDMSGEALGAIAWLKKLRGNRKGTNPGGKGEMKMLRQLPKLLRFIPGTAQDMRAYFLTLQYWLAGSEQNIVNMVRLLVDRYADGPRRGLRGVVNPAAPLEYADIGVYHPRMKGRIADVADGLPAVANERGTVGVLLLRSYLLAGNSGHYDGVIAAFEAKGLRVVHACWHPPSVETLRPYLDEGGRLREKSWPMAPSASPLMSNLPTRVSLTTSADDMQQIIASQSPRRAASAGITART